MLSSPEFMTWRDNAAIDAENVDEAWTDFQEEICEDDDPNCWSAQDAIEEFRSGTHRTGIPCDWSRHYESRSVAAKMFDGTYVGWTFWFGGGKHGEPQAIDWMSDAYELDYRAEEKLVLVETFTKRA